MNGPQSTSVLLLNVNSTSFRPALRLPTLFGFASLLLASPIWADEDNGEILTRGPVHEAFASAVVYNPEPGPVVTKLPPAPIEELPPDQKPEGENVIWISGYWSWDEDRTDYIWISGIWRDIPRGRQWIPGYWMQDDGGHRWVSGYWGDTGKPDGSYVSQAPPNSLEAGPNTPTPSEDHVWVSGYWVWQGGRYFWSPGYWQVVRPTEVWVPASYVWTPHGYLFVGGYWDYVVARRGIVFAPVYFTPVHRVSYGWHYRPRSIISISVFDDCLFYHPRRGHYYYGDYYASSYQQSGFFISFSFHSHRGYDPIYAHRRWQHRRDPHWHKHQRETYEHRRNNPDSRPPRTFAAQEKSPKSSASRIAMPLEEATSPGRTSGADGSESLSPARLRKVEAAEQEAIKQQRKLDEKLAKDRQKMESREAKSKPAVSSTEPLVAGNPPDSQDRSGKVEKIEKSAKPEKNDKAAQVDDASAPGTRTAEIPKPEKNADKKDKEPKPIKTAAQTPTVQPVESKKSAKPESSGTFQPEKVKEPKEKSKPSPSPGIQTTRTTQVKVPEPKKTKETRPVPAPTYNPPAPSYQPQPQPQSPSYIPPQRDSGKQDNRKNSGQQEKNKNKNKDPYR